MTIKEINNMIKGVSEKLVPVTLKSIAEPYSKIIFPSSHSRAGEIMTFSEYEKLILPKDTAPLTKEMYDKTFKELQAEDWFSQIDIDYAYQYHRERRSKILEDLIDALGDEEFIIDIIELSDEELVEAIRRAGERVNELKDKKGSKYNDYSFIDMLREEFEKELRK